MYTTLQEVTISIVMSVCLSIHLPVCLSSCMEQLSTYAGFSWKFM